MSVIIALSGKKQSGKSTLAEYLKTRLLFSQVPEIENFIQDQSGKVFVKVRDESSLVRDRDIQFHSKITLPERHLRIVIYSFADALKEFCINVLGLSPEQVYGTDEQKNSLTDMCWYTVPEYIRWKNGTREVRTKNNECLIKDLSIDSELEYLEKLREGYHFDGFKMGRMTAREIMQVVGTDVMRNMFSDKIWVNATFRKIKNDNPDVAIIADMRFPSEVFALEENNGYTIRLKRIVSSSDIHPSEISLDNWEWKNDDKHLVVPEDADIPTKNEIAWNFVKNIEIP